MSILWTAKQREIFNLLKSGARPVDVEQQGYNHAQINKINKEFKAGRIPPAVKSRSKKKRAVSSGGKPATPPAETGKPSEELRREYSQPDSYTTVRTFDPIQIATIVIEPADWRINQYGGFLITNTHDYAKRKFGYTGSVGDFICDACQLARMAMGLDTMSGEYLLKEESNNGGKQPDEGTRLPEAAGADASGK